MQGYLWTYASYHRLSGGESILIVLPAGILDDGVHSALRRKTAFVLDPGCVHVMMTAVAGGVPRIVRRFRNNGGTAGRCRTKR